MKHIKTIIIISFLLLSTIGFSQDNELTKRAVNKVLSETQQNFLNKITNKETTKRHKIIELNLDVLKSVSITLTLFDGKTITINKEIKKTKGPSSYSWKGSSPDKQARLILIVNNNEAMGSLMLNNKAYRIESLGGNTYVLIEIDQSKFQPEGCIFNQKNKIEGNKNGSSNKQPGLGFSASRSATGCNLRLLVAYTPAAAGQVANILNLIELAVEETNDSYNNSGVNNKVELVYVTAVNYTESTDSETDRNRFANREDGFMDEIHQLRNLSSADVGVLIVDNANYTTPVCGTVTLAGIHTDDNPNQAFVLVDWNCATGNFSFAHEIGHLQGARHQINADPTDIPFEWGHGYVNPGIVTQSGKWRTIMALPEALTTRIPFWSNPNVNHPVDGTPMGTVANNDNARVLNETTPKMLNYRVPSKNITLSNIVIPNNGFADVLAVSTIETSNFIVEDGATVNLVAGDIIRIGDGSSIKGDFSAKTRPVTPCCSDNIIPIIPNGSGITFEACLGGGSQLCLGVNCADNYSVSIFNNAGQLVSQNSGAIDDNIICIWDGANASSGLYKAEIVVSNGTQNQSLIYQILLNSLICKKAAIKDVVIDEIQPDSTLQQENISELNSTPTFLVYPNPVNNYANIEYSIPSSDKITLYITNSFGQEVLRLIDNQSIKKGNYTASFDATHLSSGIYYYTIKFGQTSKTKKLILIK